MIRGGQVFENPFSRRRLRCHFDQPDRRFDRFNLAEEGTEGCEIVMPPMLQQSSGFRGHLPLAGGKPPPAFDLIANFVDAGVDIVLLFFGRQPLDVFKHDLLLSLGDFPFFRLRNWRKKLGAPTGFDDLLCRLPALVQFPMPLRTLVRRVEDRVLEEWVGNRSDPLKRESNNHVAEIADPMQPVICRF